MTDWAPATDLPHGATTVAVMRARTQGRQSWPNLLVTRVGKVGVRWDWTEKARKKSLTGHWNEPYKRDMRLASADVFVRNRADRENEDSFGGAESVCIGRHASYRGPYEVGKKADAGSDDGGAE